MPVPTLTLKNGHAIPVLGQGTWELGEPSANRAAEIATLRAGVELGLSLIDTAEMYGHGRSERLVGEAIRGLSEHVYLVDKVLPSNASHAGTVKACERSLKALGVEQIDLYLLHWRGGHPLAETVQAFEQLQRAGKIGGWGVSNFDTDDMRELLQLGTPQVNQILYNPSRRGPEFDLMPLCAQAGVRIMAYSPIEQGRLLRHPALAQVAQRHQATVAQVALAWDIRGGDVVAIPKASTVAHVQDNARALDIRLTDADIALIDEAFAPATHAQPLEMI